MDCPTDPDGYASGMAGHCAGSGRRLARSTVGRTTPSSSGQGRDAQASLTMPAFVLDTNTVIDYFKGRGKVAARLLAVTPREIALPAIAAYEVWVGVLGSQQAKRRQA